MPRDAPGSSLTPASDLVTWWGDFRRPHGLDGITDFSRRSPALSSGGGQGGAPPKKRRQRMLGGWCSESCWRDIERAQGRVGRRGEARRQPRQPWPSLDGLPGGLEAGDSREMSRRVQGGSRWVAGMSPSASAEAGRPPRDQGERELPEEA